MLNVKLGLEQMMFKDFFHWAYTVSELRFWKSHPAATQCCGFQCPGVNFLLARARLMMWLVKIYDFFPCMFGGWTSVLALFYVHQGGFWPIPRCRYWWFLLPGYTGYVQSTIEAQGTMAQTGKRRFWLVAHTGSRHVQVWIVAVGCRTHWSLCQPVHAPARGLAICRYFYLQPSNGSNRFPTSATSFLSIISSQTGPGGFKIFVFFPFLFVTLL